MVPWGSDRHVVRGVSGVPCCNTLKLNKVLVGEEEDEWVLGTAIPLPPMTEGGIGLGGTLGDEEWVGMEGI